ncbi:hypothetical protein NMY22_g16973 [Coprinellus aureogranulatus]|nr:hypothetical protein NMY22_g16973 [Coprinellus aureogranulatus]
MDTCFRNAGTPVADVAFSQSVRLRFPFALHHFTPLCDCLSTQSQLSLPKAHQGPSTPAISWGITRLSGETVVTLDGTPIMFREASLMGDHSKVSVFNLSFGDFQPIMGSLAIVRLIQVTSRR